MAKRSAAADRLRQEREARGWSQLELARRLTEAAEQDPHRPARLPSVSHVKRRICAWENGENRVSSFYGKLYGTVFEMAESELFGGTGYESLRQDLDEVLTTGTMSDATLDDWEHTVRRYGHTARTKPAPLILNDLGSDLTDLKQALAQQRSASTARRLTRVAAHMAGLMCLTHVKLDDRDAFRRWARTARLAAQEAGDPTTMSWVLAQEAYGHYYARDLLEAVDVAQAAQLAASPCVGAVLAAALEARAHAALGAVRAREVQAALARAEDLLAALAPDEISDSAFGYCEAQLLFHRGNAYTHLGDTAAAWQAQDRALNLYPEADFLDRVLTRLDRTLCLARDGDSAGALEYATDTLIPLTHDQRAGIINLRGREVLEVIPRQQRALPAVRQLRELLTPSE